MPPFPSTPGQGWSSSLHPFPSPPKSSRRLPRTRVAATWLSSTTSRPTRTRRCGRPSSDTESTTVTYRRTAPTLTRSRTPFPSSSVWSDPALSAAPRVCGEPSDISSTGSRAPSAESTSGTAATWLQKLKVRSGPADPISEAAKNAGPSCFLTTRPRVVFDAGLNSFRSSHGSRRR